VIADSEAAALAERALHARVGRVTAQSLTQSGNGIFRIDLADGRCVVLRESERRLSFEWTRHNLSILRSLGLPVQTVLASGDTSAGGAFLILNWLAGRDLVFEIATMTLAQMTAVATAVTDCQRRVAALPRGRHFGWAPIGGDGGIESWSDIFGPAALASEPAEAPLLGRLRQRLRSLRLRLEPYFRTRVPVCFLDDLTTKNVIVENGALTGIIDIDFVCYGDPLMSVGTTLAELDADVGHAGRIYGDELLRCWAPDRDGVRAAWFYSALWSVGFLARAAANGDVGRVAALVPVASAAVERAEAE
jgi:aminoglycoside phosphotransferase (APT) family kinase protein